MRLTKDGLKNIGKFDGANRYYIDEFFQTETDRAIRKPSRAWPFSQYKHALTENYFASLSDEQREQLNALRCGRAIKKS